MSNQPDLSPVQISAQTKKILASQGFVRSERHSRFLEYIVDHALQGKMNRLKGYTIGIDVFDRDATFDPNVDSIVRVEAGRLRVKLHEYYRSEGQSDPLIIDLPKGSYVPVFFLNNTPQVPEKSESSFEHWIATRQPAASLAVLPLVNLKGDPSLEYFSDGITEALNVELSKAPSLRVISMSSMMCFKGSGKSAKEIARELNVTHVLEGSVLKDGNTVRISIRLIDGARDFNVWAESYAREMEELIRFPSEAAQAVTTQLTTELRPGPDSYGTLNRDALEAYLLGRRYRNELTLEGYYKAREYFKQAIELDPKFPQAYTGLASCFCSLGSHGFEVEDPRQLIPEGISSAQSALLLNERQPEAHAFMGIMLLKYSWDWSGAEYSFKRALELSPNDPRAAMQYSMYFESLAKHEQAINLAQAAQAVDPMSKAVRLNLAWQLYQGDKLSEAETRYQDLLKQYPDFWGGHWGIAQIFRDQGRQDETIRALQRAVLLSGGYPLTYQVLGHYYGKTGQVDRAMKIIGELELKAATTYVSPFCFAMIHAGLGNRNQCFDWLEKAYELHSRSLAWLYVTREFRPYHRDPQFIDLIKRIGIPVN